MDDEVRRFKTMEIETKIVRILIVRNTVNSAAIVNCVFSGFIYFNRFFEE